MRVEKNVPEIRFEGFSGEWKISQLSELALFNPKEELPVTFKYVDLESVKGTSLLGCREELKESAPSRAQRLAKKGDVFFQTVRPYQKNNYLFNMEEIDFVFSTGYAQLRPYYDGNFLLNLIQRDSFVKDVLDNCTGTSYPAINASILASLEVISPEGKEEQTAIGNTFQKLDNLINQHKRKHDKLNNIKKAMLEKMFPKQGETIPEIRFKGFKGEWVEKAFSICFANIPNNTLSRADLNYEAGMAKNIHYGDVLIKFGEVLDTRKETLPFITSDEVATKLKHAALRNGDIIIADAAEDSTVGKCTELFNVHDQLVFSGLHTIAVRPILPFSSKYLGYYLNSSSYHDQLLSLMQGTKVLSISKTAIQNTNVQFPKSDEEQTQIGNYFHKLDVLIGQHQQQITKLNNIKQACLGKMFV